MCVHWLNLIDIKLCYISVQRHRVFAWLLLLFCCCVVKSSHMVNSGSNTYKSYILWIGSNIVLGWFINKIIIHSNSPTIDWYSWRKKKLRDSKPISFEPHRRPAPMTCLMTRVMITFFRQFIHCTIWDIFHLLVVSAFSAPRTHWNHLRQDNFHLLSNFITAFYF